MTDKLRGQWLVVSGQCLAAGNWPLATGLPAMKLYPSGITGAWRTK